MIYKCEFESFPIIPIKIITGLKELVECSFIFPKHIPITHLDLSLREFSRYKSNLETNSEEKNVFLTEEAARKRFAPNRKILYEYHLDVLKEFELSLRNGPFDFKRYYSRTLINQVIIEYGPRSYYDLLLFYALTTTNEKVKLIRTGCRMAECLPIPSIAKDCILKNGLNWLYFEKADSIVIVDLLTTMQFRNQHFVALNNDVFEFVLNKANQARFNLWTVPCFITINYCVFSVIFEKVVILLKYHNDSRFCTTSYNACKNKASSTLIGFKMDLECPVENGFITRERHLRILQTFDVSLSYDNNKLRVMQMLWRSIPDPFITMYDLTCVFNRHENPSFVEKVCHFLEEVTGEKVSEEMTCQPRKLKHYCGVTIRNILSNNFQLLTGINKLIVPTWTARLRMPTRIGEKGLSIKIDEPELSTWISDQGLPTSIKEFLRLERW